MTDAAKWKLARCAYEVAASNVRLVTRCGHDGNGSGGRRGLMVAALRRELAQADAEFTAALEAAARAA